ncbi:MAG: ATPase [Oscillospiraceae bacterium]|nr:ATPase [Oscillospiraceae bacterium]
MAIEKMALVNITGALSDLDQTILHCFDSGLFHPESVCASSKDFRCFQLLKSENPYPELLSHILSLSSKLNTALKYIKHNDNSVDIDSAENYLLQLEKRVSSIHERMSVLKNEMYMRKKAIEQIQHNEKLNINFDDIFSCKHVHMRFGRLPEENYLKLSYYDNEVFFFFPLDYDQNFYWGVYFAPESNLIMVDDIFQSLYFERIHIPDFAHGTPNLAINSINESLKKEQEQLSRLQKQIDNITAEQGDNLSRLYSKVRFLSETYDLRKYVMSYKDKFHLTGFVPLSGISEFTALFKNLKAVNCTAHPDDSDKRLTVPVKLKNNRFARPFEMFVEMYGLPDYSGLDPTFYMAAAYTLLFGIMFGDLGQGLFISLAGWLLWKIKKIPLGRIMQRLGISSAVFGCVYGSVFGLEGLLEPVYHALGLPDGPVRVFENGMANRLLLASVGIGIVLIIISICINIFLGIKKKDAERAVFSSNGIAGLIFFASIVTAFSLNIFMGIDLFSPLYITAFILIPIVLMFLREPLAKLVNREPKPFLKDSVGGFIAQAFFELFEFVLSFITNTVSFLRIGGFIISHAGMMTVVLILSEMAGSTGSIPVIIIGNIFVIGLEGLIVGIQVLRLHYYEIFSRFYDGDGKPYVPVRALFDIERIK